MTLNAVWSLVLDGKVCIFKKKLLISDFQVQIPPIFTETSHRKNISVNASSVGESPLLMNETRLLQAKKNATVTKITTLYNRYMQKCISDCKTRRILRQMVCSCKTPRHWVTSLLDLMSFNFFCDIRKRQAFVVKQLESMDPSCLLPMVWTGLKVSQTVWGIYSCYTLESLNAATYVLSLN